MFNKSSSCFRKGKEIKFDFKLTYKKVMELNDFSSENVFLKSLPVFRRSETWI